MVTHGTVQFYVFVLLDQLRKLTYIRLSNGNKGKGKAKDEYLKGKRERLDTKHKKSGKSEQI